MLIFDKQKKETYLFEVKHSDKFAENQSIHLEDEEFCDYIENRFGKIKPKIVLYNGKNDFKHDIPRVSASEFLIKIYQNYKNNDFELNKAIDSIRGVNE